MNKLQILLSHEIYNAMMRTMTHVDAYTQMAIFRGMTIKNQNL